MPAPEHHGVVNRLDKELDTSGVSEKLRELNNSLKGDKILVLLPTANEQKVKVLKHFFPDFLETLMFEILPGINSKVLVAERYIPPPC